MAIAGDVMTLPSTLLIDAGNTRIKWATLAAAGLTAQRAAVHAGWSIADVRERIVDAQPPPQRVIVSNVAGPRIAALLIDAAVEAWGIQPILVSSTAAAAGVRNAYSEPAKLGVDRWLAMIAAHRLESGAVCVVSVGTAMTIDSLDASGQHLGGLIVPGPDLMMRSLLGGTSDIAARVAASPMSDVIFATNTATAIRNGARHALAALVMTSLHSTQQQTGQKSVLIITGGASGEVEPLLPVDCRVIPDLVLRGLAVMALLS